MATSSVVMLAQPESGDGPEEHFFGGGSGVYGVEDLGQGVAGFDVSSREKIAWLQDVQHGRGDLSVEITDVRVAPVPYLDLEVTLTRGHDYFVWPAQATQRMVVKGVEQVWIVVRATGPGCPFGPPGTSFLAEPTVTVDYKREGRRRTATTQLDPMLVAVPAGAAC